MIRHVMKDGTILKDVSGMIVKRNEAPALYAVLDRVTRKEGYEDGNSTKSSAEPSNMAG